jgi:hypothetical protein
LTIDRGDAIRPGEVRVVDAAIDVMEATLWKKNGWVARVSRIGDSEPVLVGPWTMGRDKKNPKPMNAKDFGTLVKTASEFLERAVQHRNAQLHRTIDVYEGMTRFRVDLDIGTDEDDPHATLTCFDASNSLMHKVRVPPNFKLTAASAERFAKTGSVNAASDRG